MTWLCIENTDQIRPGLESEYVIVRKRGQANKNFA
jgi:hypothetical protein